MKIKTIFKIVIAIGILQIMPLIISLFSSPKFSLMLTTDTFGFTPSDDAMLMFGNFALVLSFVFVGIIFHMIGAMSFTDQSVLRRLSFLYFVLFGFLSATDLVAFNSRVQHGSTNSSYYFRFSFFRTIVLWFKKRYSINS